MNELLDWLDEGSNKAAWNHVACLLDLLDQHREHPEVLAMRADAKKEAFRSHRFVRRVPNWVYAVAAAGIVLVIAGGAIQSFPAAEKPVVYSTGIGQMRVVALADGSHVTLDSSSSITVVNLSHKARTLVLTKGRAHFDVAHDPARPFKVTVGSETVVAVGTVFDIEKLGSKTLVTLAQGRVEVESRTKQEFLKPGEELVVSRAGDIQIMHVDLRVASAWERGQIVLNDEPLDEVADQLNRYLTTPLVVDPAIAKLRISGVFNVGQIKSFVSTITSYFPIQYRAENGHILLEKRT